MQQNATTEISALSTRQAQALPHIALGNTITESARLAGIDRVTLYRWMEDPKFRNELQRLRIEAAELAKFELKGMMLKAALVINEVMENDNPYVRLRAATSALSIALKANDITDIERNLDRLDQALRL